VTKYVVIVTRLAEKELSDLPVSVFSRARRAIATLKENPRPSGCKKLKNARNGRRVRVSDYRIPYTIDDVRCAVDIEAVRHRR
jgi:mRNA interferase RelE/StbE